MLALLLVAALWQAPAAIRVPNGETRSFELPPVAGAVRLHLRAHAAYWRPAGSNHWLRIVVNGRVAGLRRDRRTARLRGASTRDGGPRFDFGRWRVSQGPVATSDDDFALDVSDLVRSGEPIALTLDAARAGTLGPTPLVVEDLRLEPADGVTALPTGPDWRTPRLALPAPPRYEVAVEPAAIRLGVGGTTQVVDTTVIGGAHQWTRAIERHATHVEVRDTITNPTASIVGLRIRHAIRTDAAFMHLGGRLDPDVADAYSPWNPTVFTPVGAGGLGLVAEDDVFRQQVYVDFDQGDDTLGLRTDMLCLPPGERQTLVWSIYPVATPSYWDFINTVRADWGVDHTVPGSFVWFTPDAVLAMPPERLRAALARQGTSVASMFGGWIDPHRNERPPFIGFGAAVLDDRFAAYRDRIRDAVRRLKDARRDLRVLLYFDAQRDSSPDARRRFPDSLLLDDGGRPERADWGGQVSPSFGMVPTAGNGFGRAMSDVARAMRGLGADGLYWDEMDGVDYRAPRVTTRVFDGHTCRLDDDGTVRAQLGLVNLVSDAAKLAYAGTGLVLGNVPPTTRRFTDRPDLRMVEAQDDGAPWGPMGHLTTPLAYVGDRRDFAAARAKIDEGLLPVGSSFEVEHELTARLFPFTPEYLQPGTLRGRERIVTTESRTHGWRHGDRPLRLFRYDADGKEHAASWHVKARHGGVFVRVRLAPNEVAVIQHDDAP